MTHPRVLRLAPLLVVVAIAGLSGCASGSRVPLPVSVSPSPTAMTKPVTTATIRVARDGLTIVGSDGSTLQLLSYKSDPADAIAALTTRLGASPVTQTFAANACADAQTRASWGDGFGLTYATNDPGGAAKSFSVRTDAPTTTGNVSVETPEGFSVGDPVKAMIAGTPGVITQGEDNPSSFGIRVFSDLDAGQNGVVVDSDPTTLLISIIFAPGNVNQDC